MKDKFETFKGLTNTIHKLRKQNETLWKYKEAFKDAVVKAEHLEKQLSVKRNVVKIIGRTGKDTLYALMIKDIQDTIDGLYIEVYLPFDLPNLSHKKETKK